MEWGMRQGGEEANQGLANSIKQSPLEGTCRSVPQRLSDTCRSLLDCPDQEQLPLVKSCLQRDINSQARLFLQGT